MYNARKEGGSAITELAGLRNHVDGYRYTPVPSEITRRDIGQIADSILAGNNVLEVDVRTGLAEVFFRDRAGLFKGCKKNPTECVIVKLPDDQGISLLIENSLGDQVLYRLLGNNLQIQERHGGSSWMEKKVDSNQFGLGFMRRAISILGMHVWSK